MSSADQLVFTEPTSPAQAHLSTFSVEAAAPQTVSVIFLRDLTLWVSAMLHSNAAVSARQRQIALQAPLVRLVSRHAVVAFAWTTAAARVPRLE